MYVWKFDLVYYDLTSTRVVEMSVANNNYFQNYPHLDDHTIRTTVLILLGSNHLLHLLYIELTISFLIGRKHTVNFRNQRVWRHLTADYTIIISRALKVMGKHVMYDRGACFLSFVLLAVSEETKTWLPLCLSRLMYNKTIITFGFCNIQNNEGHGKGYQPRPWLFWISQKPHPIIILLFTSVCQGLWFLGWLSNSELF